MKLKVIAKLFFALNVLIGLSACSSSKTETDPGAAYRNYSSQQLFSLGEKALVKNNYRSAIKYFEALDSLYPYNSNSEQASKDIIYSYFMKKDYASAEAAADRYVRVYPQGANVDYAYYMKGRSQMAQNRTFLQRIFPVDIAQRDRQTLEDAFYSFRDLVQFYPHSPYAADACARMIYLRDLFAQHELEVAQFYFHEGAYQAAINRADYILRHYPKTPQIKEALVILVKANTKLGLTESAERARAVLQQNDPKIK